MGLGTQSNDLPAALAEERGDVLSDTRAETPDWDALTIELRCPRCRYDVRRLPQPRCPECGLQFSWGELIAAVQQRLSCPLFEYHWRHRPVRSFFGTLGRALLPWTLWRATRMTIEPRLVPLLVLVLLTGALYVGICVGAACAVDWLTRAPAAGWYIFRTSGIVEVLGELELRRVLGVYALLILTGVVLQIFQQTINRYRIRWQHFARVMLLAGTSLLLWRAVLVLLLYVQYAINAPVWRWSGITVAWSAYSDWRELLIDPVSMGVFVLAVATGLSRYLQVRRGWAMGILSVFIVLLALVAPVPAMTVLFGRTDNHYVGALNDLWPGMVQIIGRVLAY